MSVRTVRDGLSEHYARKWRQHDGYWLQHYPLSQRVYASHLERRNAAILAAVPDGLRSVLDVGCGVGDLMLPLAGKAKCVCGVDIAPVNVQQAKRNLSRSGVGNFALLRSGAETLPFRSQSFDAIVMADVIEHIPSIETALREAARVLRPGGLLVCVTPHAAVLEAISRADLALQRLVLLLLRRSAPRYERVYERFLSPSELRGALQGAGFTVSAYRRVCFYPGREGGGVFGLLMHRLYLLLGEGRFRAVAERIVSVFTFIDNMQFLNQKQMWVARAPK